MSENVNEILGAAGAEGAQVKAVDYLYHASAEDFKKIPGSPIAYWLNDATYKAFGEVSKLTEIGHACSGVQTGNNELYLKYWQEVSIQKIGFKFENLESAELSDKKWFPHKKGGSFRRWYGNCDYVVNWSEKGKEIKNNPSARPQNYGYWFQEAVTWSHTSSGLFSARYSEKGLTFNVEGPSFFSANSKLALGYFCSAPALHFMQIMNPTLHFLVGSVSQLPFKELPNDLANLIEEDVSKLVSICQIDWNTYETSWDFTSNPLIQLHTENPSETLAENYQAWWDLNQATIAEMHRLEEENNRLFIDAYGLQDELTPDVPLEEITLTVNPKYRYGGNASDAELAARFQSDTVCELISYAIGCMMGRYSLDRPGLVYAHAGNAGFAGLVNEEAYRSFAADEDGIIPLTDQEWFADDATHRLVQFVKTLWGEASLSANLAFMAQSLSLHALKPKASESSLDILRRYLSSQFFKDHCRTYKKRPIYWLFSSGKQKAFECLVYLHRYNESTLARMRTEYVVPLIGKLHSEAENLQRLADNAESTAQANKAKKALADLAKKQQELSAFDDRLKHYADQRITLDLDDGVKVNYAKFGELLADSKAISGKG